ncbi:hypothetical protein [Clostridium sp. L74]|uniref:hypothetical protein n=1 Tax=Clostridium sp. L74 TaxID=1560217 RepID=UPI0006ABD6D6|nr:hypothetical protein [Clostridium sp. L74]KOR25186.1 hypothetical protein ND00_18790 [Clostridium sp. L74]
MSSEKTLVFSFMMELYKLLPNAKFDFAYQAYNDISGKDKFLDLLIYLEENYKVALELKLPKSINGNNSNQTETRKNIYRDILRLNYLIENKVNNIKKGYFLCGVNEAAYLNKGTANRYKECQVYDGRVIKVGVPLNIDEFNELPQLTKELKFEWTNIKTGDKNTVAGKFAWLKIEL